MKVFTLEDWNAFMRNELYVICEDEEATTSFLLLCMTKRLVWIDEAPVDEWSPLGVHHPKEIAYEYINKERIKGLAYTDLYEDAGLNPKMEVKFFPHKYIPQKKMTDIGV